MFNFVKLTNASVYHDSNPIYINLDHITTVYENNVVEVDQTLPKKNTILYSAAGDKFWEVKETLEEVMKVINNAK